MNSSKVGSSVLLLCLVCLFIPSTMLAQEQSEPPCCYGSSINQPAPGTSIETQNLMILFDILIDISISQPVTGVTGATTATVVSNSEIPLMLPKDSFRAVNSRRANSLMS